MPTRITRRLGACLLLSAAGALTIACSPAYNWRDVRHEGAPLRALMPCKPERAERDVPLLGPGVPPSHLQMMSCDAGGNTFVLAVVRLPDALAEDAASQALRQWRQASWSSLRQAVPAEGGAPQGWAATPCQVAGASTAECWSGPGLNHQGEPLTAQIRWAVRHGWMLQAAIYGRAVPAAVPGTFFDALGFE